jgi:thiol-disulfide isomerase/thioredoxin
MATRRRRRPDPAAMEAEPELKKPAKRELLALAAVGVALVVVLAAVYVYTNDGGHIGYVPGDMSDLAADFSIVDTEGNAFSLAQYRGSVIILDFMGTTCEPCKTQIEHLKSVQASYGASGVKIMSIDVNAADTSSYLHGYKLQSGATWSFAVDSGGASIEYAIASIPTIVIIDEEGRIAKRNVGVMSAGEIATVINPLIGA